MTCLEKRIAPPTPVTLSIAVLYRTVPYCTLGTLTYRTVPYSEVPSRTVVLYLTYGTSWSGQDAAVLLHQTWLLA